MFAHKKQKHPHHHQQQQPHHHHKSKLGCFGAYHPDDLEGAPIAIVPSLPPRKETTPRSVPENEQNNQAFSLVLATAVAAGAAVAAAADVSRLSNTPRQNGKANQEKAATTIQTAYRGYLVWNFINPIYLEQTLLTQMK